MFNVTPLFTTLMQTAPQGAGTQQPNPLLAMAPFFLMFIIFYFLLIRPQKKKQQQHQEMLKQLKKGDKVITSGGILGAIVGVKEKTVVLKIGDQDTKIEILKSSVSVINDQSMEG